MSWQTVAMAGLALAGWALSELFELVREWMRK